MPEKPPETAYPRARRRRPATLVVLSVATAIVFFACSKKPERKSVENEVTFTSPQRDHNPEADRLVAQAGAPGTDAKTRVGLYEKALAIEPNHPVAAARLAAILAQDPGADAARLIDLLSIATDGDPTDRASFLALARARLRLASADIPGARKAYERAIELNPGQPDPFIELARTYSSGDRPKPEEAARLLRTALRVAPKRGDIALELGRALEAAGDAHGAEAAYHYVIEKSEGEGAEKWKDEAAIQIKRLSGG